MKNLIRLAIALIAGVAAYSQDIEPSKMTFSYPQVLASSPLQSKYYYGWNIVDAPRALNFRYKLTALHGGQQFEYYSDSRNPLFHMPDSLELVFIMDSLCRQQNSPLDATAMMWYPWLPSVTGDAFKPYKNDRSGASLPFLNRNTTLGSVDSTVQSGETVYRWHLRRDTTLTTPQPVFSQPWLSEEFVYKGDTRNVNPNDDVQRFYDTRHCYISVNLRRTDSTDVGLPPNDTILVLRLPYRCYNGQSGYISFDSIAHALFSVTNHARGAWRRLALNSSTDLTQFVITRSMLPKGTDAKRDITVSAFFYADGLPKRGNTYTNPLFNVRWGKPEGFKIDTMGIEAVYYPSSTDVSIRWAKVESPSARRLFWGSQDNGIRNSLNWRMRRLRDFNTAFNRHYRIKRFYFVEEYTAALWQTERYINRIVDTLAASEGDVFHEPQLRYTTMLRDNWSGITPAFSPTAAAPYSNQAFNSYEGAEDQFKRMNIRSRNTGVTIRGYSGEKFQPKDYELQFRLPGHPYYYDSTDILSLPLPPMSESEYQRKIIAESDSTPVTSVQHAIERKLTTGGFLSPTSYIFTSAPWWSNLWVSPLVMEYPVLDETHPVTPLHKRSLIYGRFRMMTGEEARFALWNAVLLGAKGIYLYGGNISNSIILRDRDSLDTLTNHNHDLVNVDFGISPNNDARDTSITLDPAQILNDPDIGTDWLDTTGGRNDYYTRSYRRFFRYSDSTYRAKLRMPGVYMGYRSIRHVIDTSFSTFRRFDTTLMKLQLMGWYAKGMRKYLLGDTALFLRYIDTNRLRHVVSKINYGGVRDSWDSSLYDVTLHRHKDYSPDTVVYIGIQNRRTNSLVYHAESGDTTWMPWKDFDDSVAVHPSQRYSQLGARSITLPLRYKPAGADSNLYALLRVRELGGTLDTIVRPNSDIVLNFQPGEGKILQIRALLPDKNVSGYLTFSNQRKMIRYPYVRPDGSRSNDSVVYHVVYHRQDTMGIWRVWYRRSLPTTSKDDNYNVRWLPEIVLSDSMYKGQELMRTDCHCKYPAVVVVPYTDGTGEHGANVVFACNPGGATQKNFITEARIVQKNNILRVTKTVLSEYNGRNLEEWGTPVVGSSGFGSLFYAWSDSLHPIQSLRKMSNTDSYLPWMRDSVDYFERDTSYNYNHPIIAQHPSVNSYPDSGAVYEHGALVWQQYMATPVQAQNPPYPTLPYTGVWQTCYTRIQYVASQLQHYLPPNLWYANNVSINPFGNVAQLSAGCSDNILPVVQRTRLLTLPDSGYNWLGDAVYWEHRGYSYGGLWGENCLGRNDSLLSESRIEQLSIALRDSLSGTLGNVALFQQRAWIEYTPPRAAQMRKPNVAQGYDDQTGGLGRYLSLNFEIKDTAAGSHGISYHLDDPPHVLMFGALGIGKPLNSGAETPQLSAWEQYLPYSRKGENRRVVEQFSSLLPMNPPRLTETAEWLLRSNVEDERYKSRSFAGFAYTVGGSGEAEYCLVSAAEKESQGETQEIGFESHRGGIRERDIVQQPDSLCSQWFRIGSRLRVGFYLQTTDSNIARMELVRKRDGRRIALERLNTPRRSYPYKVYQFTGGNGEEYRLVLRKNYTYAQVSRRTVIGRLGSGMLGREQEEGGEELINLQEVAGEDALQLSLYPNPADGYVLLRCDGAKDEGTSYELSIYTQLGQRVYSAMIHSDVTERINTSSLPPGVYRVQVRANKGAVSLPLLLLR